MPRAGLTTIAIPTQTEADPDNITADTYRYDPDDYTEDALHGFELHRARKEHLGQTWLEYINAQSALTTAPDQLDIDAIATALSDELGDDPDEIETARRVVDEIEGAVREAAYQGGREALRER